MSSIVHVNKENFKGNVLNSEGVVLLDFWAPWCAPCRMLGQVLEELIEEVDNVTVCKVNVDEEGELAHEYAITSIPAVFLFKDGKKVGNFVGFRSKDDLLEIISKM